MKKKDVNYFDLFLDAAKLCNEAALKLEEMLNGSCAAFNQCMADIHRIENAADELYHIVYSHLNRSFITPIEREDILETARCIERTVDTIDEVSIMIDLLSVTEIRAEGLALAKLIVKSTAVLVDATGEFHNFKKPKQLSDYLVEVNHIEEQGDKLYQSALRKLFAEEENAKQIIIWKNIFDTMEDVLDSCEDVADVIEGVIVKNT
ncbi:MAG: DUF47 family protein [Oscillospiraceae bacterium]